MLACYMITSVISAGGLGNVDATPSPIQRLTKLLQQRQNDFRGVRVPLCSSAGIRHGRGHCSARCWGRAEIAQDIHKQMSEHETMCPASHQRAQTELPFVRDRRRALFVAVSLVQHSGRAVSSPRLATDVTPFHCSLQAAMEVPEAFGSSTARTSGADCHQQVHGKPLRSRMLPTNFPLAPRA
mmetsp:Transcript_20002/g.64478  ORF Transcript_20002/g.64478 Transcript_20002/m.64478 type:complete len:183 (-) Transcript_20002:208-756(-)